MIQSWAGKDLASPALFVCLIWTPLMETDVCTFMDLVSFQSSFTIVLKLWKKSSHSGSVVYLPYLYKQLDFGPSAKGFLVLFYSQYYKLLHKFLDL